MPGHDTPLIAIIAIGLALAFVLGLAAHRLRVSPLVGYLLAGIFVGPFTPGFVADQALANELAEIGVILLMFAVGLHFSLKDLMSVRAIALPGAVVQIAVATLLGMALAWSLGWTMGAGLIFGLALSVASTVVLVRALQERRILETERGRIAVGWLIVEDLVMVLALVMLPALSGALGGQGGNGVLGSRSLFRLRSPWSRSRPSSHHVDCRPARRSLDHALRRPYRLARAVPPVGLRRSARRGLRGGGAVRGVVRAWCLLRRHGAGESPLSQRATEEALPLRDAFAVLFFVSVGMLFDPGVLIRSPWTVLATVTIITVGKTIAAFLIVRAFGRSNSTALTISASLAQIGEFSFILAGLGVSMGVLPTEGRDLILAGAIISILLNPFLFVIFERLRSRSAPAAALPEIAAPVPTPTATSSLTGHDIVVGYGRVGSLVGSGLRAAGHPVLVFEERVDEVAAARRDGAEVVVGNAADPQVLAAANLPLARRLFVTVPEAFEAGQVVEQARAANPDLEIVARAHSNAAVGHLEDLGCSLAVMGEHEIAMRMLEHAGVDEAKPEVSPEEAAVSRA